MLETRVSFGRTQAWDSGWRGKQSSTPIRLDGNEVGEIKGTEAPGQPGVMHYRLPGFSKAQGGGRIYWTLAEAKGAARSALDAR